MGYLKFLMPAILSFFSFEIQGQELFPIQNFAPDIYHGEAQNWDISQSREKNIYIANNKGLLEFNGANWKLYPSPNHTIMRSVKVYGDKIYTGCYMEFGYWKRDEFFNLRYTSLSEKIKNDLLEDEQFWKILCYQQWVFFQSLHRIYVYNSQNNEFQIITSKKNLTQVFEVGNQLYFQMIGKGLFQLDGGNSSLVSDFPVLRNNIIVNIFLNNENLLIQTLEKGFFILKNGTVSPWQTEASSKINTLSIYSSLQLGDGTFALGTIGEGIYFLSSDGRITMHIDKKKGLQNNTLLSLFQDADSNIWLGLDNGISVLNYTSPFRVYADTKGNLGTVYATEFFHDFLYLGTNQGLFYRPLKSMDDFKIVEGTKGQVWTLKTIGETLFCGHNSGTYTIKDNQAELISGIMGTWDIHPISDTDNLLLQGNYEGLHILEKKNGKWRYRNKIEGFNISSRYFEVLPDNQIFVSHEYVGVFKLNVTSDFMRVIKYTREQSVPLSFNSGIAKYDGKLLYFCDSGLYEYNTQKSQFRKDTLLTKLVLSEDSYLSGKLLNEEDQILLSFTEESIIFLSPGKVDKKPQITRISLPVSLRENMVGYENLLHLGKKLYLLGTVEGYILFDLDKIDYKEKFIHINSIDKSKLNGDRTNIPLLAEDYKLKAKENNLSFSYNVPEYDKFLQTKYQYKLEGMYDNWSDWTQEAKASFNNLPPGEYTFKVRARTGHKLSANIESFGFSIASPWYFSGWMKLVYVLIFFLILFVISNLYRRNYKRQNQKIMEEKKKELAMMKLENEQERIKLKNENLNCEIETINKELASTTIAIIKKNELLNAIKNNLQEEKDSQKVKAALKIIDENLEINTDWKSFQEAYDNTDRDFLKKLKELHPLLTPNDLKLCVFLRLNLSSKEMAPMLNISPQSVEIKRFRLRKKMDLGHETNLTEYVLSL